jgi:nucleotide-binding universal stress UspA family protein
MKQGNDILGSGGRFGRNGTKYVVAYSPDDGGRAALAAARLFCSADVVLAVCAIVPDRRGCPNAAEWPTEYPGSMRGPAAKPFDEAKQFLGDEVDAVYISRAARSPAEGILELVAELDARMMILGSAASVPLGRSTVGGVDSGLVHAMQVPTLLTPPGYRSERGVRLQQITYGYEWPAPSEAPLAIAAELALRHGVNPMLVTNINGRRLKTARWGDGDVLVVGSSSLVISRLFDRSNGSTIVCNAPVPTVVVPDRSVYPLSIPPEPPSSARHGMSSEPPREATSGLPRPPTCVPHQSPLRLHKHDPHHHMTHESAYHCPICEVEGRDLNPEPFCWSCGAPAVVTSRPLLNSPGPQPNKSAVTPRNRPTDGEQ